MATDNKTVFGHSRHIVYICVMFLCCQHQWLLPNVVENQKFKCIGKRCEGCQRRQMLSWESYSLSVTFSFLFPLIHEAIHCFLRGFKSEWQYFMRTSENWNTTHVFYFTDVFTKELNILALIGHFVEKRKRDIRNCMVVYWKIHLLGAMHHRLSCKTLGENYGGWNPTIMQIPLNHSLKLAWWISLKTKLLNSLKPS